MDEPPRPGEEGLTVVELTIVLAILSVVVAIFASVVLIVQKNLVITADRSLSTDEVRLAVQQIDRQVRSGNVFFPPTENAGLVCPAGTQCGMNLVIYTQTNADTEGSRCMQWRIEGEELQTRFWLPLDPGGSTSWRRVADNVVNDTGTPRIPAFVLQDPVSAGRLLTARIVTNRSLASGRDSEVTASVNGRNTQYGFPSSQCEVVPSP